MPIIYTMRKCVIYMQCKRYTFYNKKFRGVRRGHSIVIKMQWTNECQDNKKSHILAHFETNKKLTESKKEIPPNRNDIIVLSSRHAIRMYEAKIEIQRMRADLDSIGRDITATPYLLTVYTACTVYDGACSSQLAPSVGYAGNSKEIHEQVGYNVDREWTEKVSRMSARLNAMCLIAAGNSSFYALNHEDDLGDMPTPVNADQLTSLHINDAVAYHSIEDAKLAVLDLCGFLTWISSVSTSWRGFLMDSERKYLDSLKLDGRSKRGAIFKLSSDYHELNLEHWTRYSVPVHYPWTTDEINQGCFVRCSPKYIREVIEVRECKGGGEVLLEELTLPDETLDNLKRFDVWFQDSHAKQRGYVSSSWFPKDHYYIVDFLGNRARTLVNWCEICVCAERFKCTKTRCTKGMTILFFRQSLLQPDEPRNPDFAPRSHRWALTHFAKGEFWGRMDETEVYTEKESLVKEKHKNKWAQRPERCFNPYDGGVREKTWMIAQRGSKVETTHVQPPALVRDIARPVQLEEAETGGGIAHLFAEKDLHQAGDQSPWKDALLDPPAPEGAPRIQA
ncbi:hypothetical protein K438DRAFT_1766181 [Mycena galopus ATCC 62051]|nr:hypothetical protein K438DRAFT_1766181 [Mycena galopus ATCC 62051]